MSDKAPKTFVEWLLALPIPWLFGNAIGQDEARSWGGVIDSEILRLMQAQKIHYPNLADPINPDDFVAPLDALPPLGEMRQLERGPREGETSFHGRLDCVWEDWERAGTWPELLAQLSFAGFDGAVIVQQNGLSDRLSLQPMQFCIDPSSFDVIEPLDLLVTPLTSSRHPDRTPIPAGVPWWVFDNDIEHTSRFAILFPGVGSAPSGSVPYPFLTWAHAFSPDFTATEFDVTWSNPMDGNDYQVVTGQISQTGPVSVAVHNKTPTGCTVSISPAAVVDIDLVAFQPGSNPFANLSKDNQGRLSRIIRRWRPAWAQCMGVFVLQSGEMWGWPLGTWGDPGTWGGSSVVQFEGG